MLCAGAGTQPQPWAGAAAACGKSRHLAILTRGGPAGPTAHVRQGSSFCSRSFLVTAERAWPVGCCLSGSVGLPSSERGQATLRACELGPGPVRDKFAA